jgi:hypothetical protein
MMTIRHRLLPLLRQPRFFSTVRPRNPNLKQIIQQGMPYLDQITKDVQENTQEPLFATRSKGPTPDQLSEALRVLDAVQTVVDQLQNQRGEYVIQGQGIVILDAEVSPSCRQARVLWSLPLHLDGIRPDVEEKVADRMQQQLENGKIQSHVFARLKSYRPPEITFVNVPVRTAISAFLMADDDEEER